MKNWIIGIALTILVIGGLIGLSYAFGWVGVHQTKTIYKAKENAKREVFEQTQSYVEGKRQSALKYYQEYQKANESQKQGLKSIISQDFANFDEDKYLTGELRNFIHGCKYNP
jgi:hypothetical protein